MKCRVPLLFHYIIIIGFGVFPLFAQNLIMNGTMESAEGWEILYYNADELPEYEFNFMDEGLSGVNSFWHIKACPSSTLFLSSLFLMSLTLMMLLH